MKLILHIGTEKTGTTTTQIWASRNRDALVRQGVFYSRMLGSTCHLKLHLWCLKPGRHDESFRRIKIVSEADQRAFRARLPDELAAEVSEARKAGCRTFLISNELCHSRLTSVKEVEKARELLEPHFDQIELICALRPQIDLAVSHASNLTKASQRVTRAFFDEVGPDSTYFNYNTFLQRWFDVFGAKKFRLVPIRRTPDFSAVLAAQAGIDTKDLEPPVRFNEALDVRVMAMMNAMNLRQVSESPADEPLAYINRDVLKQLACERRLEPGLEVARSVQARFEESNRNLTNDRTDVEFSDLEPDWSRYDGAGNLDLLDQPCVFSGELAALVKIFNQDIALAEMHNEITDAERHLDRNHPVLARRCLNSAIFSLKLLKKGDVSSHRIRRFETRVEAIEKGLADIGDAPKSERRNRDVPREERHGKAPKRERRAHDSQKGERRNRDFPREERHSQALKGERHAQNEERRTHDSQKAERRNRDFPRAERHSQALKGERHAQNEERRSHDSQKAERRNRDFPREERHSQALKGDRNAQNEERPSHDSQKAERHGQNPQKGERRRSRKPREEKRRLRSQQQADTV